MTTATLRPAGPGDVPALVGLEAALFAAIGDKIVDVRCQQQDTEASGISVGCTYRYHTFRSEELGQGPFEQGPDVFVVRNGKIVSISPFVRADDGLQNAIWDDFRIWLSIQHPDDVALMYEGESPDRPLWGIDGWLFSEESVALWEKHTREHVELVRSGALAAEQPAEAAAPDPDKAASIVAHYEAFHVGYAIVYDDGNP